MYTRTPLERFRGLEGMLRTANILNEIGKCYGFVKSHCHYIEFNNVHSDGRNDERVEVRIYVINSQVIKELGIRTYVDMKAGKIVWELM